LDSGLRKILNSMSVMYLRYTFSSSTEQGCTSDRE
jgi:hypothetical protein